MNNRSPLLTALLNPLNLLMLVLTVATGLCSAWWLDRFEAQLTGTNNAMDKVIDYILEDFIQSAETYDVIFDAVDNLPFS